jgi:hypothetical protein
MWRKFRRGIAASAVALAMLLAGAAQPARAEDGDTISGPIVDLGLIAWDIYKSGTASPDQIVKFVRLVTGVLTDMENEVNAHADGIQAAEVLRQANSVRIEMLDYESIRDNEFYIGDFAAKVLGYAQNASGKYGAVDSRKAKDQIGLGGQVLYPITLTARTDAGLRNGLSEINADYRQLNQRIVAELEPTCTRAGDPDPIPGQILATYTCTAANGETAVATEFKVGDTWYSGPVDLPSLKLQAARNSSWAAAKRILAGQGN